MICKILIISKIQVICSNILNVYCTKESSSSVVDVHDVHVPLLTLWGWHVPLLPYVWWPCLLLCPQPWSFFFPHWLSFAIWINSSSINVASIGRGDNATSGTTSGVEDASIGVIGVSLIGGGLILVNGASLRTDVCLVPFLRALPLVHTPPDWGWSCVAATTLNGVWSYKGGTMDDIGCWWGGGLMLVDGRAVRLIFVINL